MKKRIANIADFIGTSTVLRVDRKPIDDLPLIGFVVGVTKKLVLLNLVDGNTLQLNGYAAVRLSDIRSFQVDESFVGRALQLLNRDPAVPDGIDLTDWKPLIDSIQSRYPLLMAEFEKKEPGCGFIGQVVKQTPRRIQLEKVNTLGKWEKAERFAVKDLTKIEFDGGYVNALTHLVAHEEER